MVIDYCGICFLHGAGNLNLTQSALPCTPYNTMHTRRHMYFMMIHPPSLLPDITKTRREILSEEW